MAGVKVSKCYLGNGYLYYNKEYVCHEYYLKTQCETATSAEQLSSISREITRTELERRARVNDILRST